MIMSNFYPDLSSCRFYSDITQSFQLITQHNSLSLFYQTCFYLSLFIIFVYPLSLPYACPCSSLSSVLFSPLFLSHACPCFSLILFTPLSFPHPCPFFYFCPIGAIDMQESPSARIVLGSIAKVGTGCFDIMLPLGNTN